MKGDDKLFEAPFLTLAEMELRWPDGRLNNDMITSFNIDITGHFGEIVSPYFQFAGTCQGICAGYASTPNVGFIIRRVAQLLDLFEDDTRDFGRAVKNCPVRLYSWGHGGDSVMDTVCIGHFMKDKFLYGHDLMRTGLPKAGTEGGRS